MWKIISKPVDTYEISLNDTQHEYIVYVKADRQLVTESMTKKYGDKIKLIEHSEE